MKTYYPIPMHIHSVWERNASMEGHFYNAQKLGIRHMYITDHDVRMGRKAEHVEKFDFTNGLYIDEASDTNTAKYQGFKTTKQEENTSITVENALLNMQASGKDENWSNASVTFDTTGKRHEYALLAGLKLEIELGAIAEDANARVIIDVELSQRPPEHKNAHLLYVFGATDELEAPLYHIIPMQTQAQMQKYCLNLLDDAASVGGGDNVCKTIALTVSARRGKTSSLQCKGIRFSWEAEFDQARKLQQKLADSLGKKYDVTPYVITEISAAGVHKNCFCTRVPILDYAAHDYKISCAQAREHVRRYGGLYSLNHPFADFKRITPHASAEEKAKMLSDRTTECIQNRALDADLIEIGFPMGRHGFEFEEYMHLWDALSSAGIFITAYGDSDAHCNNETWFEDNNFIGYIAADDPCEESFMQSMRTGDLYTGDPVHLKNTTVRFTAENGQRMGSVLCANTPHTATLDIQNLPEGCTAVWYTNGKIAKTQPCTHEYKDSIEIPNTDTVNFVRVVLYKDGRCMLMTNPIYTTSDAGAKAEAQAKGRWYDD